jgi:hypothetical protein
MPYKVVLGRDKKGNYAKSSERLHSKKYYYKTEQGKTLAKSKARKQIIAVSIKEGLYR